MIKFLIILHIIDIFLCASLDQIFVISDIHYDILYNSASPQHDFCKNMKSPLSNEVKSYDFGRFECNTNKNLLISTLKKIKDINNNPQLILLGGDLISHKIMELSLQDPKEIIKKTLREFVSVISDFFPNTVVLPTTGNNDFYERYNVPVGDSKVDQYSSWKNTFFSDLRIKRLLNSDYETTLNDGSYYSYKFSEELTFISLNSNYFNNKNFVKDDITPINQLQFLNRTLSSLKIGSKAILFNHISAFPQFFGNKTDFYWKTRYVNLMERIMYQNKERIILTLNFHIHFSSFGVRKQTNESNSYYMQTVMFPALSPVYKNNPGFGTILMDSSLSIKDINYYYFMLNYTLDSANQQFSIKTDLNTDLLWNLTFSYKQDLGFTSFDALDFYDFATNRLLNSSDMRSNYLNLLGGYTRDTFDLNLKRLVEMGFIDPDNQFKYFLCVKTCLYQVEMAACLNKAISKLKRHFLK